jgi:carbon-monoxide dehydrogenase large subunit
VPVESVRVEQGDTSKAVFGLGTFGSRSAVIATGSIAGAAREVRAKILAVAGHLLETAPDDLELKDGIVSVRGAPAQAMPIGAVAGAIYFGGPAVRPPDLVEPTLSATRHYDPPETYSNGTVVSVVEVDIETGLVRIDRIATVEDCGTVVNPLIVDGQVAGAIAQGVGIALLEELHYDEDGQLQTSTLMDYLYPSATEIPPIEIGHLETPSPFTEHGVKGMGEGGTIAAPAAVVCAVADALRPLGVKIDRAPVGPDYLVSLLAESSASDPTRS